MNFAISFFITTKGETRKFCFYFISVWGLPRRGKHYLWCHSTGGLMLLEWCFICLFFKDWLSGLWELGVWKSIWSEPVYPSERKRFVILCYSQSYFYAEREINLNFKCRFCFQYITKEIRQWVEQKQTSPMEHWSSNCVNQQTKK